MVKINSPENSNMTGGLKIGVRKDLMPNSSAVKPTGASTTAPTSMSLPEAQEAQVDGQNKQPNGTILHSTLYKQTGQAEAPPSPPAPSMPLSSAVQSAQLGIPGIPGILDPSQAVQTKAALKGWSALTGDKTGSTAQSTGPKKVSTNETFAEFRKAAKEKAEKERGLKEQQEMARQLKERSERERQRVEQERRKEKEEEDALEQARIALAGGARARSALPSQAASPPQQRPVPVLSAAPAAPAAPRQPSPPQQRPQTVTPPTTSPVAPMPSPAEQARLERERERRRREAQQNQIDMNRQSDMMAAFEENII